MLASALIVPLLGLLAGHRLGLDNAWLRARRIAHVAMVAPPLFALLGGWLDFQHAIPIGSLGVWLGLWSLLAVAAVAEPATRCAGPPARDSSCPARAVLLPGRDRTRGARRMRPATVMLGRGGSPARAAMLVATLAGTSSLISALILVGLFRA